MPRDEYGRQRRFTLDEEVEIVRSYIHEIKSLRELAKKFGADPTGISIVLERHGVKRRTYREWNRLQSEKRAQAVREALA